MFLDASEARRTMSILTASLVMIGAGNLSYAVLPNPYSRYVSLSFLMLAGLLWTFIAFQQRIARGDERTSRDFDGGILRRQAISEAAVLTGVDEHRLATGRGVLLAMLAVTSLLALTRLLWRMTS